MNASVNVNPALDTPIIDIVVLSLDRPHETLECLENLRNQEDVDPRIIVVDQGSEIENLHGLRAHSRYDIRIDLIELGENVGVAAGRNLGMRAGQSELIVSIDNDAVFASPHALKEIVGIFQGNPKLGALGFRIETGSPGELDLGSWVYPKPLLKKPDQPFLATRFCGAGHALRREALTMTHGYDEKLFFYWEELDLAYQLIQFGYQIAYEPSIVVRHKVSPTARQEWTNRRYYYLVRNALYLDWKYFRSLALFATRAGGYILKAAYNGVVRQALRGVLDAIKVSRSSGLPKDQILSRKAKEYIVAHDLSHRGSLWRRLRNEVFVKLSAQKNEK